MLKAFFKPIFEWYFAALKTFGYFAVACLMAAESTIVPFPSELIIPPAAHLAHSKPDEYHMTLWGIVVAGTLGSWLGASIMYWISRWAGRPLILRYGKFALI